MADELPTAAVEPARGGGMVISLASRADVVAFYSALLSGQVKGLALEVAIQIEKILATGT